MQSDLTPQNTGGLWTGAFWQAVMERAIKTLAQSLLATLSANGLGILNANWVAALSVAGMATVLSVLTSVASSGNGGPSLGAEKVR